MRRYSRFMATTKAKYFCMQCDMTEDKCECERYCAFCQGQMDIRLCHDGLCYCPACRQACDYQTADES